MEVRFPVSEGGDRTSLDLPKEEEVFLEAVQSTGKPLVVVLMNGSALSVNWANEHANAIIDAWYPGEEGGTAIAQTLAGVEQSSRAFARNFLQRRRPTSAIRRLPMMNRTYRYFDGQPLFPFGYGLSYSKFEYSALKLSSTTVNAGEPLGVDVDVKNTSELDGGEVVQLYLRLPKSPISSEPCTSKRRSYTSDGRANPTCSASRWRHAI